MTQPIEELERWHQEADPWDYEGNSEDARRKSILLSELPSHRYSMALDIGCGQGFITRDLPGGKVTGVDISAAAIAHAKLNADDRLQYLNMSIFDIGSLAASPTFDLVVITGVLYPHYIGRTLTFIYGLVDGLLQPGGVLASVHIDDWCKARFPYLLLKQHFYTYREFTHRLEIYVK